MDSTFARITPALSLRGGLSSPGLQLSNRSAAERGACSESHETTKHQERPDITHDGAARLEAKHDDSIRRYHHRNRTVRTTTRRPLDPERNEGGHYRAQAVRRHVRQHRMHPNQDDGGERLCGAYGAACRRVRRRDRGQRSGRYEAGEGPQGHHLRQVQDGSRVLAQGHGELYRLRGARAIRIRARSQRRRCEAHRGANLYQRGRPRLGAAMPGLDQVRYLTNSSMMEVDFLPPRLVIIGGAYVGLEFGQMFRRFGSQVTIVEKGPHLIGREDEDVSQAVREILEAEGIRFRLNAKCISLLKQGSQIG